MGELNKKVSIIMPVYNASGTIRDAVDSVLRQTYQNYELIIIEDCSKDDSLSIVRSYEQADSRIRVIENPENKGVAFSRNAGVQAAMVIISLFLTAMMSGLRTSWNSRSSCWKKPKHSLPVPRMISSTKPVSRFCGPILSLT